MPSKMAKRLKQLEEEKGNIGHDGRPAELGGSNTPMGPSQISQEQRKLTEVVDKVARRLSATGIDYERNIGGKYATASLLTNPYEKMEVKKDKQHLIVRQGQVYVIKPDNSPKSYTSALGELLFLSKQFVGRLLVVVFPEKVESEVERLFTEHRIGVWVVDEEKENSE